MEKFISFNNWVFENKDNKDPEEEIENTDDLKEEPVYGCVMMDAKIDNWEEYHLSGIDEKDLYEKPNDDSYGLEETPHVTIVYGIHEDEIDPQTIADVMEENMEPMTLAVTEIDVFEGEEYDVVKYNLPLTEQLKTYRALFMKFPNTQTFDEYHPHMTIAYVLPGKGEKYKRSLREPFKIKFTKAVYSWHSDSDDPDKLSRKVVNLEKDKKENKSLVKESQEKIKPSIFSKTIYRIPTEEELEEVHKFNLSADEIIQGLGYTIIGRGIRSQENKEKIIQSAKLLYGLYPNNKTYEEVYKKSKELKSR